MPVGSSNLLCAAVNPPQVLLGTTSSSISTSDGEALVSVADPPESTAVLRTDVLPVCGFDSMRILCLRGEILQNTGNSPGVLDPTDASC